MIHCAKIPVSRFITAWWKCIAWQSAQSDSRQSTDTVSERVPTRQRTESEQRENNNCQVEKCWHSAKNSTKKKEGLQRSNISRFPSVLCEGYNYTPYAFTMPYRATTTHSESRIIKAAVFSDNLTVSNN